METVFLFYHYQLCWSVIIVDKSSLR